MGALRTVILCGIWLAAAPLTAAPAPAASAPAPAATVQGPADPVSEINPFKKNYVAVELARNYPMSFTQNGYEPGRYFPAFSYLHNLDESWIMGLGAQFKILNKKDPETGFLGLWTVSHETLYVVRLNHPTYVLVGPKILYLLPTRSAKIPLQKEPNFASEIGGGLSLGLTRVVRERFLLTMRAERWRGTRTMQLHGFEVAFGFGWGFD